MKRSFTNYLYTLIFIYLASIFGCSGENAVTPEKKVNASIRSKETLTIYDVLKDYPGLENFFTYGELTISEFEDRLFGDFLGNTATADVLVSMKDLFPNLIDTGTATMQIFSTEVEAEMESKGPVPDFISTIGVITDSVINVEESKRVPFYDYLEKLDIMQKNTPDAQGTMDYVLDMLVDVTGYLDTLDEDAIDLFMNYSAIDGMEMQLKEDGKIDYADLEELIEKFATKAPEGLVEIFEGMRDLFYDDDFKTICSGLLNSIGVFLGNEKAYPEIKALLENIYKRYDKKSLGELIDRLWTKGPIIGPFIEELDIEKYGANGKQESALRELLMHPAIVNDTLETLYHFQQEGYGFDKIDDHLIKMINTDIFCQDRKGEGEFGNGNFYEPTENVSYRDLSSLRAALIVPQRWNVPFTLTSPWIYETEGAEASKKFIRSMVPQADSLSIASLIWADMYEKDPDKYMGGGKPVTEKKGYGIMLKGVYNAPICPALLSAGSVPFFLMGEAVCNGPYDNIYDNLRWLSYERNMYITIDLIQFSEYVPLLKNIVLPFLKLMGYKQLPVTLIKCKGARSIIYLEVANVIDNMVASLTNELLDIKMPKWMITLVIDTLKAWLPMGSPIEGEDRVYLMSQDVRDTANLVWALSYYDAKAFHPDRFLNTNDSEEHKYYYDIRDYTFEKNSDTANPLWNFVGGACVSLYRTYSEIVNDFPKSMDAVEDRQNAAIKELGLIFPGTYLFNMITSLSEISTETPGYSPGEPDIFPLVKLMEPLLLLESSGMTDNLLNLLAVLGKPELERGRKKILDGMAKLASTIEKDSDSPYTAASEFMATSRKAEKDPNRWNSLELSLDFYNGILDAESPYEIVEDLVDLVNHLTGVETSDEEWRLASEGMVEVLANGSSQRALTRARIHIATIIDEINKVDIWGDAIDVMVELLKEDGIYEYIIGGMQKDPEIPWDDVMTDTNKFIHSELMMNYDEGSFWKDLYYMLDFLSDAMETN